jgi:hypothetical protein
MLKVIRQSPDSSKQTADDARRIEDAASVRLWLVEGFPIADILTMIEVRRRFEFCPHLARAYAIEILFAAKSEMQLANQPTITYQKESHHAVA